MPPIGPMILSVNVDGSIRRAAVDSAASLDELKSKLRTALKTDVAELRCGVTGLPIKDLGEIMGGEDSLTVVHESFGDPVNEVGAGVPLEVHAKAVSFNRSAPTFLVVGRAESYIENSTAFFVALPASQADALRIDARGDRYVLHVGHQVLSSGETDPGGALAAEWAASIQRLGAHPHILTPFLYTLGTPPSETLADLPAPTRAASESGSMRGSRVQLLLTHAYAPVQPQVRHPFPALFGYALHLCKALLHARECGVVHRAVRPSVVLQALQPVPGSTGRVTMLGGWEHAILGPQKGQGPLIAQWPTQLLNSHTVLGPAPAYAAPELHSACLSLSLPSPPGSGPGGGAGKWPFISYDKADCWSLGATLAALACGQHPWQGQYPGTSTCMGPIGRLTGARGPACPEATLAAALTGIVPSAFVLLLQYMTRQDPAQRISIRGALYRLQEMGNGRPVPSLSPLVLPEEPLLLPAQGSTSTIRQLAVPGIILPSSGSGTSPGGTAMAVEESDGDAQAQGARGGAGGEGRPKVGAEVKEADEEEKEDGGTGGETGAGGGALLLHLVRTDGKAREEGPTSYAFVPYTNSDACTVGTIIAQAAPLLDSRQPSSTLSLWWAGGRVDPGAPVWRLPAELRNTLRRGRPLGLAPGLSSHPPACVVEGYGILALPVPPAYGPDMGMRAVAFGGMLPYQGGGGVVGRQASAPPALGGGTGAGAPVGTDAGGRAGQVSSAAAAASVATPFELATDVHASLNAAFSPTLKSRDISLINGCSGAMTSGQWGCVSLHGVDIVLRPWLKYTFSVSVGQLDTGSGLAIGFYDPLKFDPTRQFFGQAEGGWSYSRSGKYNDGRPGTGGAAAWQDYGEGYTMGDIVSCEIDCRAYTKSEPAILRFSKNGVSQGIAGVLPFHGEVPEASLVPGVTMGSSQGGKAVRVALDIPDVREFDRLRGHHRIMLSDDRTKVWNSGKWATVLVSHPGIRAGKLTWHVRVDETKNGAGVAVGVADLTRFDLQKQNLGASPGSWCYSKTGKKGDGSGGFTSYGKAFSTGDIITCELDMDRRTLSFSVNGDPQGVAFHFKDSNEEGGGLDKSSVLVPAVCIGSTEGDKLAKASIVNTAPVMRKFSCIERSPKIAMTDSCGAVETRDKWGTVFADYPPIRGGKFSFAVLVTSAGQGCGAGIGFAAVPAAESKTSLPPPLFDPIKRNLGAHAGSWCYSKTGKYSGTLPDAKECNKFENFGPSFKTGDVVTAELDCDQDTIRFLVNGGSVGAVRPLGGVREALAAGRYALKPAVVLGSSEGGHYTKLTLHPPAVTRFDPSRMNKHMVLDGEDTRVKTESRWCTVLADSPGACAGRIIRFAVKIEGEGGAAVGFAEASTFRVQSQNLGASWGTWAISKTGKVSNGGPEAFVPFAEKFGPNDTIGAEADMVEGIIRFWKNGALLGTAFQGLLAQQDAEWIPKPARPLTLIPAVCLGSNDGSKRSTATLVEFKQDWLR